jgi:hypothetical protein
VYQYGQNVNRLTILKDDGYFFVHIDANGRLAAHNDVFVEMLTELGQDLSGCGELGVQPKR